MEALAGAELLAWAELAAADTTLCDGDELGDDVEVATLPHPAASKITRIRRAIFREVTISDITVTIWSS